MAEHQRVVAGVSMVAAAALIIGGAVANLAPADVSQAAHSSSSDSVRHGVAEQVADARRDAARARAARDSIARVIAGGATTAPATDSTSESPQATIDPKEAERRNLWLKFTWMKSGFGAVMTATFRIKNAGAVSVKDLEITCVGFAKSGTAIDQNVRTVYVNVPAHKTTVVRDFNMGLINDQVAAADCAITDFVIE